LLACKLIVFAQTLLIKSARLLPCNKTCSPGNLVQEQEFGRFGLPGITAVRQAVASLDSTVN
jgi:hypothetical protein